MIIKALVYLGLIFMLYALGFAWDLYRLAKKIKLQRRNWIILILLIVFFILGYFSYLIYLYHENINFSYTDLLISLIFCFGAVFVIVTLKFNYDLTENLNKQNEQLLQKTNDLQDQTVKLQNTEVELEKKNKELGQLIETFYSMRLEMQRKDNSLESENIKIKKMIDTTK